MNVLKTALILSFTFFAGAMSAQVVLMQEGQIVSQTPPSPQYEQIPPSPGANYVWTPGYWAWENNNWRWISGNWILAPYSGATWVSGDWVQVGGRWSWRGGHWNEDYWDGHNWNHSNWQNRTVNDVHNTYNTYREGNWDNRNYNRSVDYNYRSVDSNMHDFNEDRERSGMDRSMESFHDADRGGGHGGGRGR